MPSLTAGEYKQRFFFKKTSWYIHNIELLFVMADQTNEQYEDFEKYTLEGKILARRPDLNYETLKKILASVGFSINLGQAWLFYPHTTGERPLIMNHCDCETLEEILKRIETQHPTPTSDSSEEVPER
jgi:hypothetical protein